MYKTLPKLAEDLSYVDEEHLIVLMADAIFRKREREFERGSRKALESMPANIMCQCGHTRGWHEEDYGAERGCMADPESGTPCACREFTPRAGGQP